MKLGEWVSNAINKARGKPYTIEENGSTLTVAVVGKHEIPEGAIIPGQGKVEVSQDVFVINGGTPLATPLIVGTTVKFEPPAEIRDLS